MQDVILHGPALEEPDRRFDAVAREVAAFGDQKENLAIRGEGRRGARKPLLRDGVVDDRRQLDRVPWGEGAQTLRRPAGPDRDKETEKDHRQEPAPGARVHEGWNSSTGTPVPAPK